VSSPSQISAGGVQEPQAHVEEQTWVPTVPHEVSQDLVAPTRQVKFSSAIPSSSSSQPLQVPE
jgi:hypothetical protein